jgi:hypothetical protein
MREYPLQGQMAALHVALYSLFPSFEGSETQFTQ